MRYIILFVWILCQFSNICVAKDFVTISRSPYFSQYYFDDIDAIEKYALNRTYSRESDLDRLKRLEELAFGAIQQGDIVSRYSNVKSAILNRPKQNNKNTIIRQLGNYFSGQMTGYTPPIYSNNYGYYKPQQYPNDLTNERYVEYGSPFHRGYRYNNFMSGNSSTIRILD